MSVLLNYQEAAKFLSLPVGTLYSWFSQKRIPVVRIPTRIVRFRRDDLDTLLGESYQEASDKSGKRDILNI